MGEIAEMLLDGTMDPETGEWNFDGADGPGFPMTGSEAAEFRRETGWGSPRRGTPSPPGQGRSAKARRRRAKRKAAEATALNRTPQP